jgi:hypothetical protein
MRSLPFYIGVFFAATASLVSCDIVENPVPVTQEKPALSATLALDSAEAAHDSIHGPVTPVQKVLLEDYTGHFCGNCPGAAVVAKNQKNLHGDRLIVVAVHANYFAKYLKAPFTTDFTMPEGEEWYTSFVVPSNPSGMINRVKVGSPSAAPQGVANWPTSIATQMARTPKVGMTLTTLYKPASKKLDIKVRSKYLANLTGKYNLSVLITEDSIVDYQQNYGAAAGGDPAYPTGYVSNYVHPHAMRQVLNGSWGTLNKENPKANDIATAYFSATLNNGWRAEKCAIVAFIYDEVTKEIVQVEEVHLGH